MNVRALADISQLLNSIRPGEDLKVDDVGDWLRDLMVSATMTALYGKNNPFTSEDVPDFLYLPFRPLRDFNSFPLVMPAQHARSNRCH